MKEKLKDAYAARSGLVHGSTLDHGKKVEPEEIHAIAGKAIRALILQGDGRPHDHLLRALDDYLIARRPGETFGDYLKSHPMGHGRKKKSVAFSAQTQKVEGG
jgi:hypothetical protein